MAGDEATMAPVSRSELLAWCAGYALFMLYAATSDFLVIDYANLMFHEAGHRVFAWGSYYTQILGGTIGQLIVPAICTAVFVRRRETTAVACCAFWTFQNFLYIATYMGDARRSALPLVGGDESDWTILFTHWGVLPQDTTIATYVRAIGWMGMLGSVGWLVWRYLASQDESVEGSRPELRAGGERL